MTKQADDIRSEIELLKKQAEKLYNMEKSGKDKYSLCGTIEVYKECAKIRSQIISKLESKLQEQKQKYASREKMIYIFGKYLDTKDECFGCIFAKDDLLGCLNNDQCKTEIVQEIKKEYNKLFESIKAKQEKP